jgi:osmotically-inducible protein OsmY
LKARRFLILAVSGLLGFAFTAAAQNTGNAPSIEQGTRELYQGTKVDVKDSVITTRIKAALLRDKLTKDYTIHVYTHERGVVELSGEVPSRNVAIRAVELAREVQGVRKIRDQLKIKE